MSVSGLILPYNNIIAEYTSRVICLENMEFSFGWRTKLDGEGQKGWIVPDVIICPFYLLYILLLSALCPRKLTWVDYSRPVSGFCLSLAMGKPSLSLGSQREEGGGGWDIYFSSSLLAGLLWVNYVHQAKVTGPLQVALCIQLSPSRFCKHFLPLFLWTQEGNRSIVLSLGYWIILCCFPTRLHLHK